jgi:hypothetical protein
MNYTANLTRHIVYVFSEANITFLNSLKVPPIAALTHSNLTLENVVFPVFDIDDAEFWETVTGEDFNESQAITIVEGFKA